MAFCFSYSFYWCSAVKAIAAISSSPSTSGAAEETTVATALTMLARAVAALFCYWSTVAYGSLTSNRLLRYSVSFFVK